MDVEVGRGQKGMTGEVQSSISISFVIPRYASVGVYEYLNS